MTVAAQKLSRTHRAHFFARLVHIFSQEAMVWPTDIVDRAATAASTGGAVPVSMKDFQMADEATGATEEGALGPEEKFDPEGSVLDTAEEEDDDNDEDNDDDDDEEVIGGGGDSAGDTEVPASEESEEAEDLKVASAASVEQENADATTLLEKEVVITDKVASVASVEQENADSATLLDKEAMITDELAPTESMEVEFSQAVDEAPLVGVTPIVQMDTSGPQAGESKFVAFDPFTAEESQETNISQNSEELQATTEEVKIDDAVPINEAESPHQGNTEKSVYSAAGTETDESVGVDDGGDSSVNKLEADAPGGRSPRRLRIFIFSLFVIALILGSIVALLFGMGLVGGRAESSLRATKAPTSSPTASPTVSPTAILVAVTETDNANRPTLTPTAAPTADDLLSLLKFISGNRLDDMSSPQYKAYQWMRNEDPVMANADSDKDIDPLRIYQRYALTTLYTSLTGEIPSFATSDECNWPTISCGSSNTQSWAKVEGWQVSTIKMPRMSLKGSIPPEISLLAPSLIHLDLSENPELTGRIPDELYTLNRLKNLYLNNCKLTGTLSEDIGNLELLEDVYLGNNKLSGPIPQSLVSPDRRTSPLRKLILHQNDLDGPLPQGLNLPEAIYVDLSFNKLTGALPSLADLSSLRQLYLDHNRLTGTIPESYTTIGIPNLVSLHLSDNELTGGVPTAWLASNEKDATSSIGTINVQNNLLTERIERDLCRLSIFAEGSLVELGADCDVCACDSLCDRCRG